MLRQIAGWSKYIHGINSKKNRSDRRLSKNRGWLSPEEAANFIRTVGCRAFACRTATRVNKYPIAGLNQPISKPRKIIEIWCSALPITITTKHKPKLPHVYEFVSPQRDALPIRHAALKDCRYGQLSYVFNNQLSFPSAGESFPYLIGLNQDSRSNSAPPRMSAHEEPSSADGPRNRPALANVVPTVIPKLRRCLLPSSDFTLSVKTAFRILSFLSRFRRSSNKFRNRPVSSFRS